MAASAILQAVVEKATSTAIQEFGRLWGVRRDLQKLRSALSAIQAVIEDAEERSVKDKAVRDWVTKLKDVAYDADDLLDEFQTEAERLKREIQGSMVQKVLSQEQETPSVVADQSRG